MDGAESKRWAHLVAANRDNSYPHKPHEKEVQCFFSGPHLLAPENVLFWVRKLAIKEACQLDLKVCVSLGDMHN